MRGACWPSKGKQMATMHKATPDSPREATEGPRPAVIFRGIFRSGTNLAKHLLLQAGLGPVAFHAGWHKHLPGAPPTHFAAPEQPLRVICCKHPLAALNSLFRYARQVDFRHFECGRDWRSVLRSSFVVCIDGAPHLPAFE